jgi:hypothetical protein
VIKRFLLANTCVFIILLDDMVCPLSSLRSFIAAFTALFICAVFPAQSAVLDEWLWSNPVPQGNSLAGITYGNGLLVTVGEFGTILTSFDGTNWTSADSGTFETLLDCAYGNGHFVAVGSFGTILTSPDGRNWLAQFGGTFYQLNAIAFGDGQFIAVGQESTILSSPDGIEWSLRANGPFSLTDITYGEGSFVAVGSRAILTSTNGISWTRRNVNLASSLEAVTHANGEFVAVGGIDSFGDFRCVVASSPDGLNWSNIFFDSPYLPRGIAYGNGQWVILGGGLDYQYEGYAPGGVLLSTDLTHWSVVESNTPPLLDIIFEIGHFIAVGPDGVIKLSSNGMSWRGLSSFNENYWIRDVEFANGNFIAVALDRLVFSPDGVQWTNVHIFSTNIYDYNADLILSVAYGHGRYVVGGEYQRLFTSTNAVNWERVATNLDVKPYVADVHQILFANDLFLAVASYQGNLLVSSNGVDWWEQSLRTNYSDYFYSQGIAYGAGLYAVLGSYGEVATSQDLTNWTRTKFPEFAYMSAITFGNGRFVAVGYNGVATSTDGTNWVFQKTLALGDLADVAFGGGYFVTSGRDEEFQPPTQRHVWISTNGIDWTPRALNTARQISEVTFGNNTFLIAGPDGLLMRSHLLSAAPAPRLALSLVGSVPYITLNGSIDRAFSLQYADDMMSTNWQTWMTIGPTNSCTVADTNVTGKARRFYRAVAGP